MDKLPAAAQSLLQKEIFAGSLYYAAIKGKYPHEGRMLNEYTSGVVIRWHAAFSFFKAKINF